MPASRDQAGEALRRCTHAEPELPRVRDEPAGQGEEREAQPLRAGRAQVGRQRERLQRAEDVVGEQAQPIPGRVGPEAAAGRDGGSVSYWYDVAGALPIAMGRGLDVIVTDSQGVPLQGGNHDIRTPVAFVVARADIAQLVPEGIRTTVCAGFLREGVAAVVA